MDLVDPSSIAQEGDTFYLIWASCLVFFMQAGFGMLEAGSVRMKNTKNILLKNILDACLGALVWWFLGYGFAFGDEADGPFIGSGAAGFALSVEDWASEYAMHGYDWASWFFQVRSAAGAASPARALLRTRCSAACARAPLQFTFAAAAATIVSGGVAERCRLSAYFAYSVGITGFIYPVVVHWVWDSQGWMSVGNHKMPAVLGGVIDFAGSGVVHMTGGVSALVAAYFLGPRIGRCARSRGCPRSDRVR